MSNNILVFLLLALSATMAFGQGTSVGFYSKTCERAESIVTSAVKAAFNNDPTIAAGLLRLHFHDCFVSGCDASVLIDGPNTERDAGPNFSLRGFEVIDDAKKQIEAICPGIVSCADILALAARDSVVATSGLGWQVPTGRRDGLVSSASDVDLPSFRDSVDVLKQRFTEKGLNTQDLVALVGAHTIGSASCQFFSYRLYNFTNGGPDPSMSPDFVATLQALCPQNGDGLKRVPFDSGSENKFDTSYFTNLKNGRGLLESDQKLYTDTSTQTFVNRLLGLRGVAGLTFGIEFGKSMVKMSNIEVKTGTDGEIRKVCSAFN